MFILPIVGVSPVSRETFNSEKFKLNPHVYIMRYLSMSKNENGYENLGFNIEKTTMLFNSANYNINVSLDKIKSDITTSIIEELYNAATVKATSVLDSKLPIILDSVATQISVETKRGVGNFIIVSKNVLVFLEDTFSTYVKNTTNVMHNNVLEHVGKLNKGMIDVYLNHLSMDDNILVGYKGASDLDAGCVFSYVQPLVQVKNNSHVVTMGTTVWDTNDTNIGGVNYYGVIEITK